MDADLAAIVPINYSVFIHHCVDGRWTIAYTHCNPRQRRTVINGEGATLPEAIQDLHERILHYHQ